MITKKSLLGIASIGTGLALSLALIASAQTASPTAKTMPQMLQVGPSGNVTLRGTVDSVGSGSLTVKSWGGDWTINISGNTKLIPTTSTAGLAQFKVGDFVGIQGTVSESASWTINASMVRDSTAQAEMVQQEMENKRQENKNKQAEQEIMRANRPRNFTGAVSAINGASFTLTSGSTVYAVNVASNAQIVNNRRLSIPLTSIQNGDMLRVYGTNASGTITAQIVRDISTPAMGTSTENSGHN